jgi:glycosyltransferase involved in cell wall biosynthesis
MLRVLTLSTLFPNAVQPTLGVFVERQTLGLAALPGVELEVVAPVGLPRWPLSRHRHYAGRARLPRREEWKGLTVHRPRFPVVPVIGQRWAARAMARALLPPLREIQARFPFDVIDAEFFWPDGPAAMMLAKSLGVPMSIKARGADILFWGSRPGIGAQIVAAAQAADGLLAVSAALKQDMVRLGMPADKINVHYTGVDLDRFEPCDRAHAKAALGIEGPLIATVGALIERKGQRLAIEALARLRDATLLLVGDGPDRKALERHARGLGVASRVRFLGARPHGEIAALMAAADVLVAPSRSEGLANVWVEAMACGTPVVASAVGGAAEAIAGAGGRLVDLDAEAIAEAVRALLDDPHDQQQVRQAARKFSWDTNSQALFEHLSRAAARA